MKRQTLHFPFCQDLGNKKVVDIIWPEKVRFSLFSFTQTMSLNNSRTIPDTDVLLPGAYYVEKVTDWKEWKTKEYQAFIAPSDYNNSEIFYVREKQVKVDIPSEFLQIWKEQPHLIEHVTFQFYFLNENLFSANLPSLRINDNYQIEVDWKIRATPSGTFIFFRSGHIFFKWKIEVRQKIVSMNLIKETWTAITNTAKKVGSVFVKTFTLGAVDLSGKEDEDLKKLASDLTSGTDGWEKTGLGKERNKKVQEQHTERMFKSTYAETLNNTIEPSIFYSNTLTFPYNLFDYWLRNEKDPYFCRLYYSNNLFNNLVHNNNVNPITYPLNITFEKLGNILKAGYWQGKLQLDYDPGGKMAECFAQGVTFYENKDNKEFANPKLGVKEMLDKIKYSGTGGDLYTSQTIVEPEIYTVPVNRHKGNNFHQRGHYFIFYEDGTQEHWLAMYPHDSQFNSKLADGHTHGVFDLHFDKPVKKMVDIYTCIGCGAHETSLFETLHSNYRRGPGQVNSPYDSLETIYKNLPFEPWYSAMCSATPDRYHLTVNGVAGRLGLKGDVWKKATQEISDGRTFTRAYGFIANSSTIQWRLSNQSSKIVFQKVPQQDDFDKMDWTPPTGMGGELEIPLTDPEIALPEPGADTMAPEPDMPIDLDNTGGEPEITIEPDITLDTDVGIDEDNAVEVDPPEIEIPDIDPPLDNDDDQDRGDKDPDDDVEEPEDFD